MARPFPPTPNLTSDHQVVGPFIAQLDELDVFQSALEPWRWTIHVLRARQDGRLTRSQACLFQDIVIETLRLSNRADSWAILAVTDTFPFVDLQRMNTLTLIWLLSHAAAMHRAVFGGVTKTLRQLLQSVITRKAQFAIQTQGLGTPFAPFLDRIATKLADHIQ